MPSFRTNFLCGIPVVKSTKFFAVFWIVVIAPVVFRFAFFVHDFIVHVLCGPYVIADDDGAVNLIISFV